MPASIHLGRVAGVPIGLHYSWFIIAALIAFSLSMKFRATHANWSGAVIWGTAIATAVLFFVTLLIHELSHAVVAKSRGMPVRSITLFALGGVAQIEKDSNNASTEFFVGVVGPVTSFVIGIICIGIARVLGWSMGGGGIVGSMLGWLGSINIVLAVFNLIPGYPLDGGRVLRAILWGIYKNGDRATRAAAKVGQIVAILFIVIGLFRFFFGFGFGGLWLIFIGWFLMTAAQASAAEVTIGEMLRNMHVGDLMADECEAVDPERSLQSVVDDVLLKTGHRCVVVKKDGRVLGIVTPADVRNVDRERWPDTTAADAMRPLETLKTVAPTTPLTEAFTTMAREDVNQLPVVADGRLKGVITRSRIMRLLQSRSELGT